MHPSVRAAAALAAAAAIALSARSLHAGTVYAGGTVTLVTDTDPHYHVLQAERLLRGAPGAPWFDPNLDWPNGATVPWPPLFDALLATAAAAVHGAAATRAEIAAVAAAVPPVLGAVSVVLVALLARALIGEGAWLLAALVLALLPAHGDVTALGRADQHALEMVTAPALWLAFVLAWRDPRPERRRAAALALAVLVAVAFWTWMGSAFVLAFPALAVALLHAAGAPDAPRASRALLVGAGGGALLVAGSLLVLGPPGALLRADAIGLTGLHVAICAGCAAAAGLLLLAQRTRPAGASPGRRAGEAILAFAVPLAALLAGSPALRQGAAGGLVALRAAGAWYSDITEFLPLVGSGHQPLAVELRRVAGIYGLMSLFAVAGAVLVVRERRSDARGRGAALVAVAWAGALAAFACARYRFTPYAALLVAPLAAEGLARSARALARRLGRPGAWAPALAALVLVAAAPTYASWRARPAQVDPRTVEILEWLGGRPPRADGREGVAAMWDLGHAVQFHARRPVVASPFGTEAGPASLSTLAAFVYARDGDAAERILARRRVGYLLLGDPLPLALDVRGFAPPGSPDVARVVLDWEKGTRIEPLGGLLPLVVSRLAVLDGEATPGGQPALGGFRLLYESAADGSRDRVKLFEAVEGARLAVEGARPGARISARVRVTTIRERTFDFTVGAVADGNGRAVLRVPYATGGNGASTAGPAVVTDGSGLAEVPVPEEAVMGGLEAPVRLRGRAAR